MFKNLQLFLSLFIFLTPMVQSQTTHIVRPGSYNIPIKEVKFTYNGSTITQTTESSGVIASTDKPINLIHFKLDVNGSAPYKTVSYVNTDVVIRNNNFNTSTVSGVGVYNLGVKTTANNKEAWETAMVSSATSSNLLNYLYYDGSSNVPSGYDFDILWTKGLKSIDYFIVGERNGNTCFALKALDSLGNVITNATILQFGKCNGTAKAEYDWNIGYAPSNYTTQPFVFTAVSIDEFNTSSNVYGFRIDNTGDADPKFFAMSAINDFSLNPSNPSIAGISGNVFLDENGLTDNTVNGSGISEASGTVLYATLDSNGVVIATMPINADGSYEFLNVPTGTYNVRISTIAGTVGSSVPQVLLPTPSNYGWELTGEYSGTGSGNDGNTNGILSTLVVTSNTLHTDNNFGIQQIPITDSYNFTINSPSMNDVQALTSDFGLDSLRGVDKEDGTISTNGDFQITDVSGLNGNVLFYDENNNGVIDAGEILTTNSYITNYDASKLKIEYSGLNSTGLSFKYAAIDEAGTADNTPATYQINWNTPLPVQLVSFTASNKGKNVQLNWTTASEINNSHFDIMRSENGQDWIKIGQVKGFGNSRKIIDYSFSDHTPKNTNFYQLKQVDYNGAFEMSNTVMISTVLVKQIKVYPNPTNGEVKINFHAEGIGNKEVKVYDLLGNMVISTNQFNSNNGALTTKIDLSNLRAGFYMVHIYAGTTYKVVRVKKR